MREVYRVTLEGALQWNREHTWWAQVTADSPEEAAALHMRNLIQQHFARRGEHIEGARIPWADVYAADELEWPPPTSVAGPFLVKRDGQADAEARPVMVEVRLLLSGR